MAWSIGCRISGHDFELWKNGMRMCRCLFGVFLPKKRLVAALEVMCSMDMMKTALLFNGCNIPGSTDWGPISNVQLCKSFKCQVLHVSGLSHLFCKSMFWLEYTVQMSTSKKKQKHQQLSSFMQWRIKLCREHSDTERIWKNHGSRTIWIKNGSTVESRHDPLKCQVIQHAGFCCSSAEKRKIFDGMSVGVSVTDERPTHTWKHVRQSDAECVRS